MTNYIQASTAFSHEVRPRIITDNLFFVGEPRWSVEVKKIIETLIRLPDGWDGYNAIPVSFDNAMFAYKMLEAICENDSETPQIVPGVSGNLQIEWHLHGGDIELLVNGPNRVEAWAEINGEEYELNLTTDFVCITKWLNLIAEKEVGLPIAV